MGHVYKDSNAVYQAWELTYWTKYSLHDVAKLTLVARKQYIPSVNKSAGHSMTTKL